MSYALCNDRYYGLLVLDVFTEWWCMLYMEIFSSCATLPTIFADALQKKYME